ncbi:hypothetical protein KVR01_006161 [Diaporthe batatas]|uniref:uncharacterized protein n=1 Tax=Diaporthe batatas TaxID=748121 RepID=UPI001D04698E|nr:uncharacterized protein KVR01_006161 [Diaporthe batatas]KAG8164243.1 hypothetical protein KVR01_006161 [Diaporthe batatas]
MGRINQSRFALEDLANHDGSHDYAYSWGYTIFRTVYGPDTDEDFARAVQRLAVYAKRFTQNNPHDNRPDQKLWSRYYSEVVQDEERLSGATESEVGDMFDVWIRDHRRAATTANASLRPNDRFLFCLMLDEESMENILELPEDPRRRNFDYGASWVKVISDTVNTTEEGVSERWWLRVGVTDHLWPLWFYPFNPDIMVEELGWEDEEDGVRNIWGDYMLWMREIDAQYEG